MTTKAQLESDLKDAMRANDDLRKRTLRMALSAIRFAEVERGAEFYRNSALDENAILAILQKEVKMREIATATLEAIAEAQHANRPDLEEASKAEIAVLERYLPKPFSPEELEVHARQAIAEVGATSSQEMGKVMKVLMPRLQGRATGDQASQVVRRLLQ
jgi:hypothetical protein